MAAGIRAGKTGGCLVFPPCDVVDHFVLQFVSISRRFRFNFQFVPFFCGDRLDGWWRAIGRRGSQRSMARSGGGNGGRRLSAKLKQFQRRGKQQQFQQQRIFRRWRWRGMVM